ncbi:MAG: ABC-2 transporter permease [Pseudomonadota bacterium]
MNTLTWLLRRELWESRFTYIVPLVVAALVLFTIPLEGALTGGIAMLLEHMKELSGAELNAAGMVFLVMLAVPFNVAMVLVLFFYLQDALYTERKDRSILFWKSLPVSDTQTVLSKFLIAAAVIPAIALVVMLATALVLTAEISVFAVLAGENPVQLLWGPIPFVSGALFLAYALFVQSLWYAPLFGWLLLTSAFARRNPILWALAPPLLVMLVEGTLLHSSNFARFLGERLSGVFPLAFDDRSFPGLSDGHVSRSAMTDWPTNMMEAANVTALVGSPGLWGGLAAAGAFIAAAIWLRRYRDESL